MTLLERLLAPAAPSVSEIIGVTLLILLFNVVTRLVGAYTVHYYGPKARRSLTPTYKPGYQQRPPAAAVPPADIGAARGD